MIVVMMIVVVIGEGMTNFDKRGQIKSVEWYPFVETAVFAYVVDIVEIIRCFRDVQVAVILGSCGPWCLLFLKIFCDL